MRCTRLRSPASSAQAGRSQQRCRASIIPSSCSGATVARRIGFDGRARRAMAALFNRISHHYHVDPPEVWRDARLNGSWDWTSSSMSTISRRPPTGPSTSRTTSAYRTLLEQNGSSGRWVLHPLQTRPFEWWYRRYYEEALPAAGAYQFVRCVKRPVHPEVRSQQPDGHGIGSTEAGLTRRRRFRAAPGTDDPG